MGNRARNFSSCAWQPCEYRNARHNVLKPSRNGLFASPTPSRLPRPRRCVMLPHASGGRDCMADGGIFVGGGGADRTEEQRLLLDLANRHGLITGATGTGKTVTMQILVEGFSAAGVPVFVADVKGDVSGLSQPGVPKDFLFSRADTIGLPDYGFRAFPVVFWDLFGTAGHPVRTTVSDMGPLLLARMLDLTEVQEGVLTIAFAVADDEDMAAARSRRSARHAGLARRERHGHRARYGNVSSASIGAIQRALLVLENQGAAQLSGRAGAGSGRHDRHPRRHGAGQRADGRPADQLAPALFDVPAVAAVGTVRASARSRQSRQAGTGVLLRRGASAVRHRAQGADRPHRAGGAADPVQGRRRLFRQPESRRHPR